MKNIYKLIPVLVVFLTACSSTSEKEEQREEQNDFSPNGAVVDFPVIKVSNQEGQNLLNENTPNYFDKEAIRLEYLNSEGAYIPYYRSHLDAVYGYFVTEDNIFYLYNAVESEFIIGDKITGIVKWNESISDTIVTQIRYEQTSESRFVEKVWINGELVGAPDGQYQLVGSVIQIKK